jgi:hypothetical protein
VPFEGATETASNPMVLYHSLNCRVALDLPFWILSATIIGKTFHTSIIIRQILSFIATDSALLAQNVFLQIFVVAVLFLYTPRGEIWREATLDESLF